MKLEIITPMNAVFEGEVNSVKLPGANGEFEVLAGHAPVISVLDRGAVTVKPKGGSEQTFYMESGVAEVLNDNIVVLSEAELSGEGGTSRSGTTSGRSTSSSAGTGTGVKTTKGSGKSRSISDGDDYDDDDYSEDDSSSYSSSGGSNYSSGSDSGSSSSSGGGGSSSGGDD